MSDGETLNVKELAAALRAGTFTPTDLLLAAARLEGIEDRLALARDAAREGVWRDLLRRFDYKQRRHIANLMAHDCTILSLELQDRFASNRGRIEGTRPLAEAVAALDKEREQRRAAARGVGEVDRG